MKARVIKKTVFVLVLCIVIFLILFLFRPFRALIIFATEPSRVKWDIDNPYIDSYYWGWNRVSSPDYDHIYIPDEWSVQDEDGIYYIFDEKDEVWAYGTLLYADTSRFEDSDDFMEYIFSAQEVEILSDEYIGTYTMNCSNLRKWFIKGENVSETVYYISLMEVFE